MDIYLKTEQDVKKMMRAGNIVAKCHRILAKTDLCGMTTLDIDLLVNSIIEDSGGKSIIKNYNGFPGYNCVSVNDCVVHGIPDDRQLVDGDIVGIDISVIFDGFVADSCWTYSVGDISEENQYLLKNTEIALQKGLAQIKPGVAIGNVSFAIEKYAKRHGLGIVRELAGHGVGTALHEEPMVPNYGKKGRGLKMACGLAIAVEPMLTIGSEEIYLADDDWSVMTDDQKASAHYEHTIIVTPDGYEIITQERSESEIENFKF